MDDKVFVEKIFFRAKEYTKWIQSYCTCKPEGDYLYEAGTDD
jgi:hypothetical protein